MEDLKKKFSIDLPQMFPPEKIPGFGPLPEIELPKLPLIPQFQVFKKEEVPAGKSGETKEVLSPVLPRVSEGSVSVRTIGNRRGKTLGTTDEEEEFYGGSDSVARRGV
jgi:hypothetical protein